MKRHQHSTTLKRSTMAIALGLAGLCVANEASAFVAYEDQANKFIISGSLRYGEEFNHNGGGSSKFFDGGSRVNLVYEHAFKNNWTVMGRWEEGFDPLFTTHNGDNHSNHYKYIALSHPKWGTVSVGKQDDLMYQFVDVWTDQPWWYADYTETSYFGNEINGGTERIPSTIKYINTVGKFTFGAMYGWSNGKVKNDYQLTEGDKGEIKSRNPYGMKRKYMAQAGAQYAFTKQLTLGSVYNHTQMESANGESADTKKTNVDAWNMGLNWTPGNWFLSAVGGYSKNGDIDINGDGHSYTHWGAFGAYTFKGLLGPAGDLQAYYDFNKKQQHGNGNNTVLRNIVGVASLSFNQHVIVALEHMFIGDAHGNPEGLEGTHDSTTLFARYNF